MRYVVEHLTNHSSSLHQKLIDGGEKALAYYRELQTSKHVADVRISSYVAEKHWVLLNMPNGSRVVTQKAVAK